jgi:hypothetical protein
VGLAAPVTPSGVDLRPWPASLLCHYHEENLWKLRAFLVRGHGELADDGWVSHAQKFISGGGMGGPSGDVRAVVEARRHRQAVP